VSDETTNQKPPKPRVRLVGKDGNAVHLIGVVRRALKNAGQIERAHEFVRRAWAAKSYDEVLCLCMEYADVR
jgi:hypothetical protein